MNINTTTSIKHKRYSTYGWSLKNEYGKYVNTLAQGEIGLLLGYKDIALDKIIEITEENFSLGLPLNEIIEIRIGTQDNQHFFDAVKVIDIDFGIKYITSLPSFGRINCLYIVTTSNIAYIWNDTLNQFTPLLGGSGSDIDADLSNYFTK